VEAAKAMEERCARVAAWMDSGTYPMKPDNPCIEMTDEEMRAYIRKRREEFMAPGGKWEKHQQKKAEDAAKRIEKSRGEKGIPE